MTQQEALDPRHRQIQDGAITMNFSTGVGRALWEENLRQVFSAMSPRFVDHVDGLIAAHDEKNASP